MKIRIIYKSSNHFYQTHDEWYWSVYDGIVPHVETYKAAYELTEDIFFERFGTHRYVDYVSFRQGKHQRLKKS